MNAMDRKSRAALFSVGSNALLVGLKLAVGLMTGAVSVISEAIHSGIDLLASAMAFVAVRAASQPADDDHAYGHGKVENLSSALEAALIFVAAILIAREAIQKFMSHEGPEHIGWGLAVMIFSSGLNFFISRYLFRVAKETDSPALEADAHHLATDVYTGLGIVVGLALVQLTGIKEFDALAALGVAVLIAKIAWDLTRQATGALLDISLPPEELQVIEGIIRAHCPPVLEFHDLRTRKSGATRHIDVHLTVPASMTILASHEVAEQVEAAILAALPNATVMTHMDAGEIDGKTGTLWRTH